MARYEFGEPIDEDDILVVQGVEYPMMPVGIRAMRRLLELRKEYQRHKESEGAEAGEVELEMAVDLVISTVRPEVRDQLKEHIETSVGPVLLMALAEAIMASFSDLDPTEPESSSGGSQTTGTDSTDGVSAEALTPAS